MRGKKSGDTANPSCALPCAAVQELVQPSVCPALAVPVHQRARWRARAAIASVPACQHGARVAIGQAQNESTAAAARSAAPEHAQGMLQRRRCTAVLLCRPFRALFPNQCTLSEFALRLVGKRDTAVEAAIDSSHIDRSVAADQSASRVVGNAGPQPAHHPPRRQLSTRRRHDHRRWIVSQCGPLFRSALLRHDVLSAASHVPEH